MPSGSAHGELAFAPSAHSPAPIHVIADHESLRRSLIALLRTWGGEPVAFEKAAGCLQYRRNAADRPACTLIDTHGLDMTLPSLLAELRSIDEDGAALILHGSAKRLEHDLDAAGRHRVRSLLKPYRVPDLFHAVQGLIA